MDGSHGLVSSVAFDEQVAVPIEALAKMMRELQELSLQVGSECFTCRKDWDDAEQEIAEICTAVSQEVFAIVGDREAEHLANERLRAELLHQWEYNHSEHCSNQWPHPDGYQCLWPEPPVLLDLPAPAVVYCLGEVTCEAPFCLWGVYSTLDAAKRACHDEAVVWDDDDKGGSYVHTPKGHTGPTKSEWTIERCTVQG